MTCGSSLLPFIGRAGSLMMVGQGNAGDLGAGLPAQFRVRPHMIVILLPGIEREAGMSQRRTTLLSIASVSSFFSFAFSSSSTFRRRACHTSKLPNFALKL